MKHPNQIMHDDIIMSQIEDQKTGILFFISEVTYEEFNKLLFRNTSWNVLSIVRMDYE